MPWYNRHPGPPPSKALTAAARPVKGPQTQFLQRTQGWQSEVWRFYDEIGELNYGIMWLANMMSRVRLKAAELVPGVDEPTVIDSGPAADAVAALGSGVGGQSRILRSLATQLSLPGDCYLVGEQADADQGDGAYDWTVRSVDEVRVQNGRFQSVSDRIPSITWSDLPPNSLPVRIWRPHERYYHVADSPARSALPILRELELVNRHIMAQYLSRLASAGVLVIPSEVEFPVREEFADAPDPFTAEWIEIAAEAIKTPGTASAVIPIPMKVPAEMADAIRHIDFTLKIDEKIIEKRQSAIARLATKIDLPAEVLTGMGSMSHWNAWQMDESGLKAHIAPNIETLCDSLTRGYLRPRLKASGVDPSRLVIWYDLSELSIRPDRSENAIQVYDRMELSGEALRRETGFNEDDAPTREELAQQGLKILARTVPNAAPAALDKLAGTKVLDVDTGSPAGSGVGGETPSAPARKTPGPPERPKGGAPSEKPPKDRAPGTSPPSAKPPSQKVPARSLDQAKLLHAVRFSVDSPAGLLLHPPGCAEHAYSCPFTHAWLGGPPSRLTTGTYEARLDAYGRLTIGSFASLSTWDWIPTRIPSTHERRLVNGHAR